MTYDQAIAHYGSAAEMARRLGIRASTVSYWRVAGIPAGPQFQIEIETRGDLLADRKVFETRRPKRRASASRQSDHTRDHSNDCGNTANS